MDTTISDIEVITWSSPDSELWVANGDGEYAGMVEFTEGRFEVRNSIGSVVGTATSVPAAREMLERHLAGRPQRSLTMRSRTSLVPFRHRLTPAPYRRTSAA